MFTLLSVLKMRINYPLTPRRMRRNAVFLALDFCTAVGQLSEPEKCCQERLMLTAQSLLNASLLSVVNRVMRALYVRPCSLLGNVPLLHTSTQRPSTSLHVTSFTKPSPALVLQATNTGVRRPGNKAINY